jgi:hypothetical protein
MQLSISNDGFVRFSWRQVVCENDRLLADGKHEAQYLLQADRSLSRKSPNTKRKWVPLTFSFRHGGSDIHFRLKTNRFAAYYRHTTDPEVIIVKRKRFLFSACLYAGRVICSLQNLCLWKLMKHNIRGKLSPGWWIIFLEQ